MIYREKITVYIRVEVGKDSMGNIKYENRPFPARANVTPLGAEQWVSLSS
ncbi:putative protein OS=Tsukamurella paurometabola (strain ATCC 8368 / DSM / CCUG 35730 /CIP 100753 / JCM 10117 / KCTC 9821 / NBRC 16120 / NCIMB 702349/ NCTC 13040) OX=521096 GN=Tpau_3900 PE=4 SV=1 [Tsukamurella paurometabola]|uniref:Uncharacterized protein n=1 Tax=Tsukamurella paurometabola (strain ATCC 8368 / DSM 20162 / CCUG 35730 / CIP 100753 / JCM 10117 / KCTC 9821 / NBRC 16120 / NCIMB 702349 / NCTC 13040) TaxID=521096 RepID=D5UMJ8_TSUPD|nr:hypothetical protein [Tsukamurella paurometabola]ADG80472.1 hypothetical protein Tpau_3900 [Tsukamurella paurometabola DSM 20162]SUP39772.1 Uncharacterised protein [Tsukamurella paurometabola]